MRLETDDVISIPASAACRVAAKYGLILDDPVILQESNNTVVWLRPHAIIAKVGRWAHSGETLQREHAVAAALAAAGAPVAPPLSGAEPTFDDETGFLVTLWQRLEHDTNGEVPSTIIAESLRRLHEGLAEYPGELPSFRAGISLARSALADDRLMAALRIGDRSMLRAAFDELCADVDERALIEQPLHGDAYIGNVLATPAGLRWIDLEGVCVGPLEWDLASLAEDAVAVFQDVDDELLGRLRLLNSARVATWCWLRAEDPGMRSHAEYHLEQLRRAQGSGRTWGDAITS
jgi:Ser/Thr protein kinase RdoA (MazF antagonist)